MVSFIFFDIRFSFSIYRENANKENTANKAVISIVVREECRNSGHQEVKYETVKESLPLLVKVLV